MEDVLAVTEKRRWFCYLSLDDYHFLQTPAKIPASQFILTTCSLSPLDCRSHRRQGLCLFWVFVVVFKKYYLFDSAGPLLWYVGSLAVACELILAACGI